MLEVLKTIWTVGGAIGGWVTLLFFVYIALDSWLDRKHR